MEDLGNGHLQCEEDGCKENGQRVSQKLSHEEPILHEQGSFQLAPHHSKALKMQKARWGRSKPKRKQLLLFPGRDVVNIQEDLGVVRTNERERNEDLSNE